MSANKLIKEWGLVTAKSIMSSNEDSEEFKVHLDGDHWKNPSVVIVKDLKRIVESYELVESWGGLDLARKVAHKNCFEFNAPLLKAIADVESCQ